jgi:hypothetical protein
VSPASLSARQQVTAAGSAAVYSVSVTANENDITDFGSGLVTVALPYTLKSGEKPAGAAVWRMDGDGNTQKMNAVFDAQTGRLVFSADHLSLYMTGYDTGYDNTDNTPNNTPAAEATGAWVNPFGDVKESDWFYGDVTYVHTNGLFGGVAADAFSPNTPMSRAMIVTVIGRMAGANVSGYSTGAGSFGDVPVGQYYAPYVAWAHANAIVGGVSGDSFAPDAPVSRQDLAVVLMNYARFRGISLPRKQTGGEFTDSDDIASYARPAVEAIYQAKIVGGKPNNLFDPRGSATRAEVAAILRRFAESVR